MMNPDILHTPCGVRFGMTGVGEKSPAPTLFIFAMSLEESLRENDFFEIGSILAEHGYRSVSLDLPCHGRDANPDEPYGLDGWRARLENGEDVIAPFLKNLAAVLDFLIAEGWTDENRVAACGTSRGGFIALHFAAADARIRAAIAFSPVVDLVGLRGFGGLDEHPALQSLALTKIASKLTNTPIWIVIGHDDEVVNTDKVIALSRAIVAADGGAQAELHVIPTPGHTTPVRSHQNAAAWLLGLWKN